MIAERDWFDLTTQPEPAVTAMVKEFYANAKEHYHFGVQVRGKTVKFSSTDINKFYNVPDEGDINQYKSYVIQGPYYDRIVRELCQPGTTWKNHE